MDNLDNQGTPGAVEVPVGTLADLSPGENGIVVGIRGDLALKRRLSAMGVVKGTEITVEHTAPMGDPRAYTLLGYLLSLRNEDARKIILNSNS